MSDLLRSDVLYMLGPVADGVVADIIRSGCSMLQLQEARVWQAQNKVFAAVGSAPRHPDGTVGDVLDILDRLEEEANAAMLADDSFSGAVFADDIGDDAWADDVETFDGEEFGEDDVEILPPDRPGLPMIAAPDITPAIVIEGNILAPAQALLASRRAMLLTTTRM